MIGRVAINRHRCSSTVSTAFLTGFNPLHTAITVFVEMINGILPLSLKLTAHRVASVYIEQAMGLKPTHGSKTITVATRPLWRIKAKQPRFHFQESTLRGGFDTRVPWKL